MLKAAKKKKYQTDNSYFAKLFFFVSKRSGQNTIESYKGLVGIPETVEIPIDVYTRRKI